MRIAHVRGRDDAASPWRLAAALDEGGTYWVDLEVARRRSIESRPALRDRLLLRTPVTTLDDHLGRGLRVAALEELVDGFVPRAGAGDDEAVLRDDQLRFGPPILRPPSFRDFYAFEQHARTTWARGGRELPEAWYRLPIFYFSNVSEIRGDGDAVWAPLGSQELDYEAEFAALIDSPMTNVPEEHGEDAIGGYLVLNDWSARDLQREESAVRMGFAKGKDFALSIGPWLVTPDELADRRPTGSTAPDLTITATIRTPDATGMRVVQATRGSWASIHHPMGAMVARASADVHLRPGELLGTGTVGGGCLLEVRNETLGRWLEPGDEVTLEAERMGRLRTPIVARPS
jgi:fumarylacetoacetate (FAA) hydrolase